MTFGLLFLFSLETFKTLNSEKFPFKLPALSFELNSLEPIIDAKTMTIHHEKHHQAYVDNLNKEIAENKRLKAENLTLGEILQDSIKLGSKVRNNSGGHWNHRFFWSILSPKKNAAIVSIPDSLQAKIVSDFGTVDHFKSKFIEEATKVFGSGWVWLIENKEKKLEIVHTSNQDNPLMNVSFRKGKPILALDVWEHAYYLQYQNRRKDYAQSFFEIVNWTQVEAYLKEDIGFDLFKKKKQDSTD